MNGSKPEIPGTEDARLPEQELAPGERKAAEAEGTGDAGTPAGEAVLVAKPDDPGPAAPPAPTFRERAARIFDGTAGLAARVGRVALRHGPVWLALAAAPVVCVWPLLPGQLPTLTDNTALDVPERIWLLALLALAAAVLGGSALLVARRHREEGPGAAARAVARLRDRLLPLLVLPFLPPILFANQETSRPVFTLALVALAAAATVLAVYRAPPAPRLSAAFAPETALSRYLPVVVLGILAAGYAALFSFFSLNQHHSLSTKIADLAIYDSIFWNSSHGNPLGTTFVRGGNHVAAHFDPLLVVLSPLYLLAPRAETILVFQSLWLASGAIPLFLVGRRHLASNWAGLALAAMWCLYPALHGANLYDFHSLTLIAPLLPWALHLADAGHAKRYAVVLALLLLAREDVSLLVCFLGLHLLLSGRSRLGLGTLLASLVWLAFAKLVVMPDPGLLMSDSRESYAYAYYFRDLIPPRMGTFGIVSTLLVNPIYALGTVLRDDKLLFFARLFLPLLFLPFLAPRGRLVLVYGLAFCLLATKGAVYSLHFQYTVLIFPVALALVPPALARIRDGGLAGRFGLDGPRLARGLLAGAVVATALVSAEYGALVPNESFMAGPQRFVRTLTDAHRVRYAALRKAVAQIPPEASVGATDHLAPHVSNRREAYAFPGPKADYYLVDANDRKARQEVQKRTRAGEMEVLFEEEKIGLYRHRERPAAAPEAAVPGAAEPEAGDPAPAGEPAPEAAEGARPTRLGPALRGPPGKLVPPVRREVVPKKAATTVSPPR